jgi:hypothetical protein
VPSSSSITLPVRRPIIVADDTPDAALLLVLARFD